MTLMVAASISVPEGAEDVDVPLFLPANVPAPKMRPKSTATARAIQSGRQERLCSARGADDGGADGAADVCGALGELCAAGVACGATGGAVGGIASLTGILVETGEVGTLDARGSLVLSCICWLLAWLLAGTFCSLLSVASQRGLQKALCNESLSLYQAKVPRRLTHDGASGMRRRADTQTSLVISVRVGVVRSTVCWVS